MRAYERLLKYVKIHTTSEETSENTPSSRRQFALAELLVQELRDLGVTDIRLDEKCYIYARIPATEGMECAPALGFIAHMDTAPDFCGENVTPQIIPDYNGEKIALGQSGLILSPEVFPHLHSLKGCTLITTDGTTLLGADDKAGLAEIMTMVEEIIKEKIPHGTICIGFTPDEEIGRGADYFDVEGFGADYAYTVDGGAENAIEYENFNAAGAKVKIKGLSVHPGDSKDTMLNAALVAMEFNQMLPSGDTPCNTEGYEGFFHLDGISGNVEETVAEYIIRDHDRNLFEQKKKMFLQCADFLNLKYGEGTVIAEVKDSYYNMKEVLKPHAHLMENASLALRELGAEPVISPVRGGTDGARLSYMGLPCPNLCTGGANYHSRFEYACVQSMETVTELLIKLSGMYADFRK